MNPMRTAEFTRRARRRNLIEIKSSSIITRLLAIYLLTNNADVAMQPVFGVGWGGRRDEGKKLRVRDDNVLIAFVLQVMSAVATHVNSISVGMCQGFSAVLLPQLLDSNSSILVNNAEASWIGESHTRRPLVGRPDLWLVRGG